MLYIDYIDNKCNVIIKTKDKDEYQDYIDFFKDIYISFDHEKKYYYYKIEKFLEMQLWYEKKNYKVVYSELALNKYKQYSDNYFIPEIKFNRRVNLDYSILNENVKLYNFQKEGVEWLLNRSRNYLCDAPGIGKTIQSIFTFSQLYKEQKINAILLVVKTGLCYNWKKSILDFVNVFKEDDIIIIENENKIQLFEKYKDKKIIIIPNHLIAHVFLSYKKGHQLKKSAKDIHWKSYVDLNKVWKDKLMLIIDEAHLFNNSSGVWTKALLSHIKYFDYRICLSATPTGNYFERFYNAMQLLDDKKLPFSEKAFLLFLSEEIGDKFNKYNIISYNMDHVEKIKKDILSIYFKKRLKEDLLEMKYKQIIKPIYIEMSPYHRNLYKKFSQYQINKIEEENEDVTPRNMFTYIMGVIDSPFFVQNKIDDTEINKLLSKWNENLDNRYLLLKSLLEDYIENQNEKVVVFENHPSTINFFADKFKKYNPLLLHGQLKLKEKDKQNIEDLFNDKTNDHKLLLCNPQVGGTGTNFNKGSNKIICTTLPNDAVLYEQLLSRCDRINNTSDDIVEILLYDCSLDIARYKLNTNRYNLNNSFLNKNLSREETKNLLEGSL